MTQKKEKKIDLEALEPEELMKYEIAGELGLLDRVMENGWKSLTAKETGRVGGILARRRKAIRSEGEAAKTEAKETAEAKYENCIALFQL